MLQISNKNVVIWFYFTFDVIIMKIDYYNGESISTPPTTRYYDMYTMYTDYYM